MNLSLPIYRNSFHPAWLLLLLPPVAGLVLLGLDLGTAAIVSELARTVLAAAFVAPLFWWRDTEAPPAVRRWMKELRPQIPGCLLSLVLPGLLALGRLGGPVSEGLWGWVLGLSLVGCPIMGATLFGGEFEHRTMAGLLSQPQPRFVIYRQKLAILSVLLLFTTLNAVLLLMVAPGWTWDFESCLWVLAVVGGVFFTTPLYTLLTRSALAGAIFTAAVPTLIVGVASLAAAIYSRVTGGAIPESWGEGLLWTGTPLYLGVCGWMGWRQFARLQVRDAGGGAAGGQEGFHPLSLPIDQLFRRMMPAGWLGQLIRKELRLHVVPWLVSGLLVGLWALLMMARMLVADPDSGGALRDPTAPAILSGLMGLLIILVSGSACVAEERQLGTLDWQLTQPLTLARQWRVKIGVALGLALACGVGLPLILLRITVGPDFLGGSSDTNWKLPVAIYAGVIVLVHFIAVYASSFSRSIMSATTAAVGIGAGLVLLMFPVGEFMSIRLETLLGQLAFHADASRISAPGWSPTQEVLMGLAITAAAALVALFLGGLLYFGSRNFRGAVISGPAVARQLGFLTILVLLPTLVLAEGITRLTALNQQAHLAHDQKGQLDRARRTLLQVLKVQESMSAVDSELLQKLGLSPGATPETITDTLLNTSSPREVYNWELTMLRWIRENTQTHSPAGSAGNPRRWTMSPEMMRRYGLTPGTLKTNASPVAPGAPPK